MTLTDTIAAVRSIPRSSRVAQGYPRIRDYALYVMRVRAERAERHTYTDSLVLARREIVARLQRILDDSIALRRQARAAAGLGREWTPPYVVQFASRTQPAVRGNSYAKYHWANCGATGTVYHPSTRIISVPAAWLIARIREEASHV
jgi:hypothetical protein